MTKFEEVKRPANGPLTELNNNMQEVFSQYRKMRQYADYLEYELKQKDEHILKVENENSFMRDERTTFDSNGNSVEPIIPQQALPKTVEDFQGELEDLIDDILDDYISDIPFDGKKYKFIEKYAPQALPVVPEFVAEYIERCKSYDCGLIWAIRPDRDANDNSEKVYDWLFPNGVKLPNGMYPNPYEPDNLVRPDKENQIKFVRAWLDGYTVEKPQLFYLKNKLTTSYLALDINTGYYEHWGEEIIPKLLNKQGYKTSFTKQEIDSMETGSYEQIEVAE